MKETADCIYLEQPRHRFGRRSGDTSDLVREELIQAMRNTRMPINTSVPLYMDGGRPAHDPTEPAERLMATTPLSSSAASISATSTPFAVASNFNNHAPEFPPLPLQQTKEPTKKNLSSSSEPGQLATSAASAPTTSNLIAIASNSNSPGPSDHYKCQRTDPKGKPCNSTFRSISNLRRHERQVHNSGKRSCIHCASSFDTGSEYRKHVHEAHRNVVYKWKCGICSKEYSQKSGVRYHLTTMHADMAGQDTWWLKWIVSRPCAG
ncbi:uncharacterized protein CIMG_02731 [Coccidioides immitis RS]|uniref:C2H2-type domain-containing protein n=2 Tax=Coccidioides immitis TaxID=5501 RepID=J3KLZ8_COCIM|nr:uncharacterized protein CIMG_02731 [Coccidioides immitis RS]EAS37377.3 hypothetical protein CIMG_02731 [Coccidioides immitis RS]KMU77094.1 hypothetical protein CISG_06132 [Coccidioides immitis RMSCC 3703]